MSFGETVDTFRLLEHWKAPKEVEDSLDSSRWMKASATSRVGGEGWIRKIWTGRDYLRSKFVTVDNSLS